MAAANQPPHPADDRVQPWSIEAEEAVIGAALLDRTAARALTAQTSPADYFKAEHRHIVTAITHLVAGDAPVDAVTVADHLRTTGTLDDAGGLEALANLQNNTPAISAAEHYAGIVRGHALRRRIIHTSADLANVGYGTDDPVEALARASDLIAELGGIDLEDISTLEVADIEALLAGDLEPEEATILATTTGRHIMYAGKMHTLQGEPECGKTWLALLACLDVMRAGGAALYIDYEDTSRGVLQRLLALGCTPELASSSFRYVQPTAALTDVERGRLWRIIDELNPDVVVIDSVGESMSTNGLAEDQAADVVTWANLLPRPIARSGAAVIMLDHVVKDSEQRGRWARGSGAKLGLIDGCALQVKNVAPFSRHKPGTSHVVVAKDRPGGVGSRGSTVAVADFVPHAGGERMALELLPHIPKDADEAGDFKPTHYMSDVAKLLAAAEAPLTASGIKAALHNHKRKLVEAAIAQLVAGGHISKAAGRNGGYTLVKPYSDPNPRQRADQPPPHTDDDAPPAELDFDEF